DDVRVPVANLVGEENKGWTYAKYLLQHERTGIAGIGFSAEALRHLKTIASAERKNGRPLLEDPYFATRIAEIEIELAALKTTNLRALAAGQDGSAGLMSSMLKIRGTEIRQAIDDLTREALGPYAAPFVFEALEPGANEGGTGPDYANPVAATYFNHRKFSIFGGSNEIQRNIIAKGIMAARMGGG
ncbi:MAG TPA: acyl-CoA dehydrogenase family protein, partial [Paracoccaceae bacterium]|nr:acyl-CoA dehydrogenase family protein [Paracoccaceae bacterium]